MSHEGEGAVNIAMKLTLNGLLRALRGQAHSVAEGSVAIRSRRPPRPVRTARAERSMPNSLENADAQPRR